MISLNNGQNPIFTSQGKEEILTFENVELTNVLYVFLKQTNKQTKKKLKEIFSIENELIKNCYVFKLKSQDCNNLPSNLKE